MGHVIFIGLHIVAVAVVGLWLLCISIPLHLIYGVLAGSRTDADRPKPSTHVRCPDCREFILKQSNVCKHCGCKLVPQ